MIHALFVAGIPFTQLLDTRRQLTHSGHGPVTGFRKFEEDQLDQQGQYDNGPAPIADDGVDMVQQPEQRFGQDVEITVVHGPVQFGRGGRHTILNLGTGEQRDMKLVLSARLDGFGMGRYAQGIETGGFLPLSIIVSHRAPFRNQGRNEVVLDKGQPAIGNDPVGKLFRGQIREGQFLVAFLLRVDRAARIGGHHDGVLTLTRATAHQLGILTALPD